MKKVLFLFALLTSLMFCVQTSAICQIARLDNVKECFSDPSGECCVVVFERDGQTCAGAFCHDYDYCAWEVFIPVQCSDE